MIIFSKEGGLWFAFWKRFSVKRKRKKNKNVGIIITTKGRKRNGCLQRSAARLAVLIRTYTLRRNKRQSIKAKTKNVSIKTRLVHYGQAVLLMLNAECLMRNCGKKNDLPYGHELATPWIEKLCFSWIAILIGIIAYICSHNELRTKSAIQFTQAIGLQFTSMHRPLKNGTTAQMRAVQGAVSTAQEAYK